MATSLGPIIFDPTLKKFPLYIEGAPRPRKSLVQKIEQVIPKNFERLEDFEVAPEEYAEAGEEDLGDEEDDHNITNLTIQKKKKKKKTPGIWALLVNDPELRVHQAAISEDAPWADNASYNYTYQDLLDRVFRRLEDNNPALIGEDKKVHILIAPKVVRDGTKKTVFINFQEICKSLRRPPDHVLAYILVELGATGSIDGEQRLVIKGRFQPPQIESILRHYYAEFVGCQGCKSSTTLLTKENRLYFVQCEQCGASRSVASIKQGYVANTTRRRNR